MLKNEKKINNVFKNAFEVNIAWFCCLLSINLTARKLNMYSKSNQAGVDKTFVYPGRSDFSAPPGIKTI